MAEDADLLRECAEPLPLPEADEFGAAFARFGDRRLVLLGESTHGSAEFYRARTAITQYLLEHHDFDFVAVEADWPDAATLNRYVRGLPPALSAPPAFARFPQWMWRNTEVQALLHALRRLNATRPPDRQIGVYGLDLYSLGSSMAAVLGYLERVDPQAAELARQRYGCLAPWQEAPADYGQAVLEAVYRKCEEAVVRQCRELLARRLDYAGEDGEAFLDAAQNARLVAAAERYYRVMYHGGADSWNLRDTHMFDTLAALLEAKGRGARGVVWAHNSHVGDARATEMGWARGELNIGQLCRQRWGEAVALVGFGTHEGQVAAARRWDGPMEVLPLKPSRAGSVERLCHDTGVARFLLDLGPGRHPELAQRLAIERLERFVGVLYLPQTELYSHYAQASLSRQFDAWVWFDRTGPVDALPSAVPAPGEVPETFPSGL